MSGMMPSVMSYPLALCLTGITGVIPLVCVIYLRGYVTDRKIANKHREKLELTANALANRYHKWMDAVKGSEIVWWIPYHEIRRIVLMPDVQAVRVYGKVYFKRQLYRNEVKITESGVLENHDPCRVLYMYYQQGDAWLKELAARTGLTIEEDSTDRLPDEEKI